MALLIAQETIGPAGDPNFINTGAAFVSIGGLSAITDVSMGIAGHVMKKNAHKVYNTWCGYKELEQETSQRNATPLELRLQSSSNGLGLALSF